MLKIPLQRRNRRYASRFSKVSILDKNPRPVLVSALPSVDLTLLRTQRLTGRAIKSLNLRSVGGSVWEGCALWAVRSRLQKAAFSAHAYSAFNIITMMIVIIIIRMSLNFAHFCCSCCYESGCLRMNLKGFQSSLLVCLWQRMHVIMVQGFCMNNG